MRVSSKLFLALTVSTMLFGGLNASAQISQANAPTRLVVGFPAGGGTDATSRMLAEKMGSILKSTVVVDNRPGAGGAIAVDYVRVQPGDGTTVLVGTTHEMVLLSATNKNIHYSGVADFKPIGLVGMFEECLVVPAGSPATTVAQWFDFVRKNRGSANVGVPAAGGVSHLIAYSLGARAKVALLAIPYKGSAPLAADLSGGHLEGGVIPGSVVEPLAKAGKLRVLACTGASRPPILPNVPTFKELGIPGLEVLEWVGMFAPASTPRATIDRLSAALGAALSSPDVQEKLKGYGLHVKASSPEELGKEMRGAEEYWGGLVKASGITVE